MLEIRGLRAGYDGHEVLHGLDLTFLDGRNYCLLGPNGCGKTTLIRAIAGLIPSQGDVRVDGVSIRQMKRREIARHMAVLSQINQIHFPYTVYDTVLLGRYSLLQGRLFGRVAAEDREWVERCLEAVRLQDLRDRRIDALSGGQQQRVFLAQVLAQDPDIILLDEPTNHLDIRHQIELVEILHRWSADGKHMVVGVLHDINLALRLSEQVILMKDGQVLAEGSFAQAADAERLRRLYDVDIAAYMRESLERWREF